MPVARIVTRYVAHESPALKDLSEQLRASGFEVVIAQPGSAGVADLVIELDEVPVHEALEAAAQLSREADADVFIAPGLFAVEAAPQPIHALEGEPAAATDLATVPAQLEATTQIPVAEPLPAVSARSPRTRLVHPPRRIATPRERQWQRAAFVASIATLAAMLGFAIAANMSPRSPLPSTLMQNSAQQQVPFGPAKMDVSSVTKSSNVHTVAPAAAARATAAQKPSPARVAPRPRARRASSESDFVAEDEVVVRHAPASRNQRAQTTGGVRRYSDEN